MTGTVVWIILNATIIGAVGAGIVFSRHRRQLEERQRAALDTIEDRLAELSDVERRMTALSERLADAEQALTLGEGRGP